MAKDNKFDLQPYLDKINEFDPNDIDWENMGSWPLTGKVIFCAIIAIVILIGGYFMMLEPMQVQLSRESKQEVPGLIDDISLAALNNGLDLKMISPQKQISTEFYNELPIQIEVEGDYHELGAYVSSVASLPRIVTLHDFSITRKGKDSDSLSLKILAKTYRYNEGD